MAEVTLTNITKKFGDFTAVDDLSMVIEDGKFTVLVGPSGCGKTTTLRMIAGLETETAGEIRIGERIVNKVPPKDRDIAMVFQNYALYPHMDVYGNMAFGLKLRKMPKKEIEKRVHDAAELLGIEEKLKSKPRELSGGQRQRVAVGRAIVRDPKVFLFDEPLSNLDAKLRVQMRTELEELHSRLKTTTIYVTHDQVEAMTLGDKIAVMKDGLIHQYASPQETYSMPSNLFVAGFIGSPAMNFVAATASFENGQTILAGSSFRIELPSSRSSDSIIGDVRIGVRPEDLDGPCPSAENAFFLKVAVKEHLGHTLLVYGYIDEVQIVASLDPHTQVEVGSEIYLAVNTKTLHVFDPVSEAMLT
ncbi:MAG: sn-glycerol-3-phosphate ABC transporter ATP-binding protein UgpC [Candidatus Atribacteria bacterium]|jgi:multiple sugar transport system ATP-binding protein|nr:MAG: sn-glycerol-3-phosphate ABC transporter ATP-binding protein UgpC [Candidatus Atribacteria bacterium]